MTSHHPSLRNQAGLTLVEILVAVLVISIGLLGVAGLHSFSLRNNQDALMRSHASSLAGDIADRMRANRSSALANDYELGITDTAPALAADSPVSVVDLNEWRGDVAAALPNGVGAIAIDAVSQIATITIQWGERSENGAVDTLQFVTETEI